MLDFLVIYPKDKTTDFLMPVVTTIQSVEDINIEIIRTDQSEMAYKETIQKVKKTSTDIPILFLGHGHSRMLYGGLIKNYAKVPLITISDNMDLLEGRTLILLACRSAEFINEIKQELRYGIGFGDLPTDMDDIIGTREFEPNAYKGVTDETIEKYREILVNSFASSIKSALRTENLIHSIQLGFRLRINKAISNILLGSRADKTILGYLLYDLKKELMFIKT